MRGVPALSHAPSHIRSPTTQRPRNQANGLRRSRRCPHPDRRSPRHVSMRRLFALSFFFPSWCLSVSFSPSLPNAEKGRRGEGGRGVLVSGGRWGVDRGLLPSCSSAAAPPSERRRRRPPLIARALRRSLVRSPRLASPRSRPRSQEPTSSATRSFSPTTPSPNDPQHNKQTHKKTKQNTLPTSARPFFFPSSYRTASSAAPSP
jgi:hypothetical protein